MMGPTTAGVHSVGGLPTTSRGHRGIGQSSVESPYVRRCPEALNEDNEGEDQGKIQCQAPSLAII